MAALEVANVLGAGFLEKVYERAMVREFSIRGISAKPQVSFPSLKLAPVDPEIRW